MAGKYSLLNKKTDCVGKCFWGPVKWTDFHITTAMYKSDKKKSFLQYLASFIENLPCDECKIHFMEIIEKKVPLKEEYLEDRDKLFTWGYYCHDRANKEINHRNGDDAKKSPPLEVVRKYYYTRL